MRLVCTVVTVLALAGPGPQRSAPATAPPPPNPTPTPTRHAGRVPDSLAVNQVEYEGWKLFHTYCDRCHGQDAVGTTLAPNLRRSVGPEGLVTHDVFIQKTSDGVVDKGMPAWKGVLTQEQMDDIWAYLRARSSGRLAPGRPHVASGPSSRS